MHRLLCAGARRGVAMLGGSCLLAVLVGYYAGLFTFFRFYYVVVLSALLVCVAGSAARFRLGWPAVKCILYVAALYGYFALSALWSLYPGHTLLMVSLEGAYLAILVIVLIWTSAESDRGVVDVVRWIPRIVLIVYIFMLLRYGVVRNANALESRSIGAISSGGAMTATMALPFVMLAVLRHGRGAVIDLMCVLAVIVLSQSRAGYLVGALMFAASWVAFADLRERTLARLLGMLAAILACGFASLAVPAVRVAMGEVVDRLMLVTSISESPADAAQETERITMYLEGWNAFLEHPLLGIGYQSLAPLTLSRHGAELSSHNLFITLVVEAGWPAFIIFLMLMSAYFSRLRSLQRTALTEARRDLARACRISMWGLLVASMFHQLVSFHLFYILLGIGFGMSAAGAIPSGRLGGPAMVKT